MTTAKRKSKLSVTEALVAGDRDLMKALMKEALQEVLEAEMTEHLGAAPGERSEGRIPMEVLRLPAAAGEQHLRHRLAAGIDVVLVVAQKRLPNDLAKILGFVMPWKEELVGIVVESTFNWYWLVDGLQAAGFKVHLANTTAIKKYEGLKHTILLETGPIERFAAAGHFASYARCVDSVHTSNGKKKGEGNTRNGNKYLAWAFVEAANFALRYCAEAKRFYEPKKARTNNVVAIKALAHKLCAGVLPHSEGAQTV